jgi:hypothetical protein
LKPFVNVAELALRGVVGGSSESSVGSGIGAASFQGTEAG